MKRTYYPPQSVVFQLHFEGRLAQNIVVTSAGNATRNVEDGWTNKKRPSDPYDCVWMPKED